MLLGVVIMLSVLIFFLGKKMEAGKHCWPDSENHWHGTEEVLNVIDDRLVADINVEAYFIKSYRRQIHPTGPAKLLFAVDMIDIATRMGLNALVTNLKKILALAESQCFLRADIDAGWW